MNRLEKIKQTIGKMSIDDIFIRNRGLMQTDDKVLESAYEKSDLVYICVSTTARAISQIPLQVGTVNRDGDWEEITNERDPYVMLLKKPNYLQDRSSFIEAIVSYLLLDGNAWVVPFPPDDPSPLSWWVVPRAFMQPMRNKDNGQLDAWEYRPSPGNTFRLEINQVAHTFFWNPFDPLMGFAPLQAGKIAITTDYKAAKFNQLFFDQGATVGGVLSTENTLTATQYTRLKEEIDGKYSGYEKAHRMMLLDGGLKFIPTAPTHKDILFPEVRGLDKERILQIFGMKKAILSIDQDSNRSISWQQEKSWWTATNLPIMKMITSALNFTFFDGTGMEVRFDTSAIEALQGGFAEKVTTAKELVEIGFTPNEVNNRLELGFDDEPWRDYVWKKIGERPVGADAPAIEEYDPADDELIPVTPEQPLLPAPEEVEEDSIIYIPKESFNTRGEHYWKVMVRRAKPIEKKFKSKTKRMFFEWRKLCLDWLYGQQAKEAEPFRLNKPLTDINKMGLTPFKRLKKEADIMYEQTLMEGLESIMLEIGEALEIDLLALEDAQIFLKLKSQELKGLVDTQAKRLRNSLSRGMEKGEDLEKLADRIRYQFETAAKRALTIARTEVYGALNYGRWETVKQTDYMKVQWFTSMDEKVRTTHKRMHGKIKRVKDYWVVGGSKLRFPGDPAGGDAGETINCRCIEVVVLDE